jgi:hypothetical protein
MTDEWLTYAQAAERLNLTVEAVRLRALRGRWQKAIGNDKSPLIRLPEGWSSDVQTTVERRERKARNDEGTTIDRAVASALIAVLEGHVATLKAELEASKGQLFTAEGRANEEAAKTARAIATFEQLAQRLEAMAVRRAIKPWWQWLLGRAG